MRHLWDHPRVCGEHLNHWGIYGVSPGSSPRMRGTLVFHVQRPVALGIIPAYAGNTRFVSRETQQEWGSSPRMRGTLVDGDFMEAEHGIIPAYAGNTSQNLANAMARWDHPRVCGEHTKRLA